ncbi:MAG: hypothetical protein LUH03_07520 [Oscillospiraceae bacterium]|nr:hypothetical protein [Oscillospiraceae bacterium]
MTEHYVEREGIIYVIPDDKLYKKYDNDEAYIDIHGSLRDSKSHKYLKRLDFFANNPPEAQTEPLPPYRSIGSQVKDDVRDFMVEGANIFIDWGVDKFLNDVFIPKIKEVRYALTNKDIKALSIVKNSNPVIEDSLTKMTAEEIEAEERSAVYHWLAMLKSLKKIKNAGVIDMSETLEKLTDPVMLQKVNSYFDKNPELLETEECVTSLSLLGRDLYQEEQFVPIQAEEIEAIAIAMSDIIRNE